MPNERVDRRLVELGLCESLELARALVMAGKVYLGEVKVLKPSQAVKPDLPLTVRGPKRSFASRGGLKLQKALQAFGLDVRGLVCMDVGASTGGFTDVLLQSGAAKVYAIDVGYGQLDYRLRQDERVCVMERTNARFLTPDMFDPRPAFGAADVSFISLKAVLPAAMAALTGEKRFVTLVKPQFEAPAEQVDKGVVRDPEVHFSVLSGIVSFVRGMGCVPRALTFSPITGPEGNIEFLLEIGQGTDPSGGVDEARIRHVLSQVYDNFMKLR